MKKYSWIVALLLALSLVILGCPNDGGKEPGPTPGDLVWKTVWEMAADEGIQALTAGALTFGAGDEGNPIKPLVRAGGDSDIAVEALKEGGKTSIKFSTGAGWGAGIDLRYAAFGFQADDKITITGELLSGDGKTQLNFNVGSEDAKGTEVRDAGPINWEITLKAADIASIKGGNPAGIRIEGRPGEIVVRIDNIKIEGYRSSNIVKLPAPVITKTETGVEWAAVEDAGGYKVFAAGIEEPIATPAFDATSVNINGIGALLPGEYDITVVASGVSGVSSDSDPSNVVKFEKTGVPSIYQVPSPGPGFFYVNLNDYQTQTPTEASINSTVPAGTLAADKLTLTFTENNQRANFKLTPAQVNSVNSGDSLKITVTATATPDTEFRYHIGNALSGASWNATDPAISGAFTTIVGEKDVSFGTNKSDETTTYFILQQRAAAETVVEITSIKIQVIGGSGPAITIDSDASFDYVSGDGPSNPDGVSLKGNIKPDISAAINALTGGEVWIYWVHVTGGDRGNNYGIGSFGGTNYSTPASGSTAEGVAIIPITAAFTLGGDGNDCIVLNPYNDCAVIKVEVYE